MTKRKRTDTTAPELPLPSQRRRRHHHPNRAETLSATTAISPASCESKSKSGARRQAEKGARPKVQSNGATRNPTLRGAEKRKSPGQRGIGGALVG